MQIGLPRHLASGYKSPSQRSRVITEAWGEQNLYCPRCPSPELQPAPPNTEAIDFTCPRCAFLFQLKSQSRPFTRRVVDAAYDAMRRAIMEGRTPDIFALHYNALRWKVHNLLLIPHYAYSLSAIIRRRPLSADARRVGWVGCDISLDRIPPDARIPVIMDGNPVSPRSVRQRYDRLRPLARLKHDQRGWRLDVLNAVRSLGKKEFTLHEVYAYADQLRRLHPRNRFIEAKIRQQLQGLRDLGFLEFIGRGRYRLNR